jgi:hypothetical protein
MGKRGPLPAFRRHKSDGPPADFEATLHRLPHVARVARSGPKDAARRVVHVCNVLRVPDELAGAEGNGPGYLAAVVDRGDGAAGGCPEGPLPRGGVEAVYLEGLTAGDRRDWEGRLDLVIGDQRKLIRLRPGVEGLEAGPLKDEAVRGLKLLVGSGGNRT